MDRPRVAVVGAGVLGLMSALRLVQGGAGVTVYEADLHGRNASAVAAGMIAPASEAWLEPALRAFAPQLLEARALWTGLARDLGLPLSERGARHLGDASALAVRADALAQLGFEARLGPPLPGAPERPTLFTPQDAALPTGPALAALRRQLEAGGGGFVAGRASRGAHGGLCVGGAPLEADAVVLATGAAGRAGGLAPELAGLRPIKGQLLRYRLATPPGPVLRGEAAYLVPQPEGIVVGASMEPGRDDLEPDPGPMAAILAEAEVLAPALASLSPRVEAGVRAETADGLPMAGPSALPGVVLVTGARRNGWLWAPLLAEIVAAHVLGRPLGPLAPLAERLHPGRFTSGSPTP